jgi:beta-lactamase class A
MNRLTFFTLTAAIMSVSASPSAENQISDTIIRRFAAIENRSGGRLGIFALNLQNKKRVAYRAGERFPMCSTFKVPLVAAVLQRVDRKEEDLAREISYGASDIEVYAPVARAHLSQGRLSIGELCRAAITLSDNTAANLLLRTIGGPVGLTAFFRAPALHDMVSRLDRTEPTLNTALPDDRRDTTTPLQMVEDLHRFLTPNCVLTQHSAQLLELWMNECKTGNKLLRAYAPSGWAAGDKSGTGENGTRNDIAIFRSSGRHSIIASAYLTGTASLDDNERDACIAEVGKIVILALE